MIGAIFGTEKLGQIHFNWKGNKSWLEHQIPELLQMMKENARDMLRMTIDINKNNFYFDKNIQPEYLNTVTCKTCHRGEPFPPED